MAELIRSMTIRSTLSWRAIFAGTLLSLLTYFILTSLGFAIGSSSLRGVIAGGGGGQALGIGSGVWLVVSGLISLYVGSYFGSRVSGEIPTRVGGVQGCVIAALFFGFIASQVGAGIGLLGSGVGSAIGSLSGAAGDLSKNERVQDTVRRAMGDLNLKSPPDQVAQGVATRLLRGDDNGAKAYLANQAGISPTEADRRLNSFKTDVQNTAKDVGVKAAKVASIAGWTIFGMLLLGSLAALLGGGAGARANLKRPLSEGDIRNIDKTRAA